MLASVSTSATFKLLSENQKIKRKFRFVLNIIKSLNKDVQESMRRCSIDYFKDFKVFFKDSLSFVVEESDDSNFLFIDYTRKQADSTELQNSVTLKKFKKESAVVTSKKFRQESILSTSRKSRQELVLLTLRKLRQNFMILTMSFNKDIMLKDDLKSTNILSDLKLFADLSLAAAIYARRDLTIRDQSRRKTLQVISAKLKFKYLTNS